MDKGCTECYKVGVESFMVESGKHICKECGGQVLDTQQMLDTIAELKQQLELYKGTLEDYGRADG